MSAPCNGIQDSLDSGKNAVGSGFQVLDPTLCQYNLDSGLPSFIVGFRILWAVFRIPLPRIPDSTSKIFLDSRFHKQNFPDFRIRIPLHGVNYVFYLSPFSSLNDLVGYCSITNNLLACEQALLFGQAKQAARERASEWQSPPLSRLLSRVYFSRYPQMDIGLLILSPWKLNP